MHRRLIKQIIYGAGYLAVLFLIVFGIYLYASKSTANCFDNKQNGNETGIDCGGACIPCDIKSLSPLQISLQKYFISGDRVITALEIKNSNQNYGADYLDYKISLLDKNETFIKGIFGNSYIYAGEIKHVIKILSMTSEEAKKIFIMNTEISNINWKNREEFSKPDIQPRSLTAELNQIPPTISGIAANNSAFSLSKATIFGFIYNNFGLIASASKTEIENIPAFGEKTFKLTFSRDLNLDNINPEGYRVFIEARQ